MKTMEIVTIALQAVSACLSVALTGLQLRQLLRRNRDPRDG
jgi:hypothetical protein